MSRKINHANYVQGNNVRALDLRRELESNELRVLSNETRKNREKASHMSLGYVMFLLVALIATAFILINYVQLQAQLTAKIDYIAKQERSLNNLKVANDEEYSRIISSIDLEEIRRIAIGELGMTYPKEGQIITYTNEGYDYVRKMADGN